MTSNLATIKELELQLRYTFSYREADFAKIKAEATRSLWSYQELLEMELDTLKKRSNGHHKTR